MNLLSGIDMLIAFADQNREAFEDDAVDALLAARSLAVDLNAKKGDRASWGVRYYDEVRAKAIAAFAEFADVDPTDSKAVIACQQKVRDYIRVAEFISRLLREASTEVDEPSGDEGDGVGDFNGTDGGPEGSDRG